MSPENHNVCKYTGIISKMILDSRYFKTTNFYIFVIMDANRSAGAMFRCARFDSLILSSTHGLLSRNLQRTILNASIVRRSVVVDVIVENFDCVSCINFFHLVFDDPSKYLLFCTNGFRYAYFSRFVPRSPFTSLPSHVNIEVSCSRIFGDVVYRSEGRMSSALVIDSVGIITMQSKIIFSAEIFNPLSQDWNFLFIGRNYNSIILCVSFLPILTTLFSILNKIHVHTSCFEFRLKILCHLCWFVSFLDVSVLYFHSRRDI